MTRPAGAAPANPRHTKTAPAAPHNALVLKGFDPLPHEPPESSPGAERVAATHGSYVVRLHAVDSELAAALQTPVGRAGAAMDTRERARDERVDVDLFTSLSQVESLRSQVLAASSDLLKLVEEVVVALQAYHRTAFSVPCRGRSLECGLRPLIMGVVNCTPDSFYAASTTSGDDAVGRAVEMVAEGADVIDVGGESTRPGSRPIAADEEIRRVVPVIEEIARRTDVPVSIDTTKSAVARAAIDAGASIINDISGLAHDPELAAVAAETGAALVLMHMRGDSTNMYERADYDDVVADVVRELRAAVAVATEAGVAAEAILVDPGIGFAKQAQHSLSVLRHIAAFRSIGRPLVVGPSRKSFIAAVLDLPTEERLEGTAAAVALAVAGGAHVLRVHDVRAMRRVADMAAAIRSEGVGWIF